MSVDPVFNQGDDPECIQQFLRNQEERVLELVEDIPNRRYSRRIRGELYLKPNRRTLGV